MKETFLLPPALRLQKETRQHWWMQVSVTSSLLAMAQFLICSALLKISSVSQGQ
jgi:hypothetical protein